MDNSGKKKREKNLKPFEKGNPGGPGRPPGKSTKTIIQEYLDGKSKDGLTHNQEIVAGLARKAKTGDPSAANALWDIEGFPAAIRT